MNRIFTNVLCSDVEATAQFYQDLLGMTRHYNSDWFIILTDPDIPNFEYGLLQRTNDIVPESEQASPAGVMVTFLVEDCNIVYDTARGMGAEIIAAPVDMPYGQRRMLLRDPEGTCLDISSVIQDYVGPD